MKDPTTEGYEVSADEIDGMVRNLCAYALGEPHPLHRYLDLTHQQVLFDGMADALRKERGKALAALLIAGATAEEIVERTNLTKALDVTKLVKAGGEAEHVKQALSAAVNAERKSAAEAKKREAAAAAEVKRSAAAAAAAERKAAAEAKRQEAAAAAAAARRKAAAATKASMPGKKRAALSEIPPGTRRVLTADEFKALAEVPAQPKKKRRASASAD
jgi:septal ring factor EnvC (AmiA/AmiB activator)